MINSGLFTSKTDLRATPQKFFDILNLEFNFDLDPCATDENHKCDKYFTEKEDGLKQDRDNQRVFVNPPYGRTIGKRIEKAYFAKGGVIVMLLPARTDTRWFHDYIYGKSEIRFIKGRLKFGTEAYWQSIWEMEFIDGKKNKLFKKYGQKNSAPFPSMVVIFRK